MPSKRNSEELDGVSSDDNISSNGTARQVTLQDDDVNDDERSAVDKTERWKPQRSTTIDIAEVNPSETRNIVAPDYPTRRNFNRQGNPKVLTTRMSELRVKTRQHEEVRWKEAKDGWFAQHIPKSDELYLRSPHQYTNVLIRNFAFSAEDRRSYQELRMHDLASPTNQELDIRLSVGIDQLQAFWTEISPRWRSFFDSVTKLPLASWQEVAPAEVARDYRWFALVYEWFDLQIESLDDLVFLAREEELASPGPEIIAQSTVSATLGPGLRGIDETSETRMREYIRSATRQRKTPLRTKRTVEKGNYRDDGELTMEEALSSASTYKTNIATLAAISFFGASVSWSAVFSGTRGDVVLLAWASTLFVCASVAAGATAIILGADAIDLDRDMKARRTLRTYVIISAIFTFGGITLLAITMCLIDPDADGPGNAPGPTSSSRLRSMQASGIFAIAVSSVEIAIALLLRSAFTPGRYKW
ncbi:hypothetical protein CALVIDRAFT_127768 [Calocera viscosa TUFC12733]|uniref:Uncharacterized protein n=1 Tax=Calocera viscosa (strain TUFC12733) TaxID=1330018 RepID=A0A167RSQ3_CALVF|nr:hypothetical protein CALVIDRAFT_127768 [Calocera viscosa TUFC12733]